MPLWRRTQLEGVLHATGPEPARNADLMAALRRSVARPAVLESGFGFTHPNLDEALSDLRLQERD